MELKVGSRLRSVVCDAEVIVVRAPAGDVDVRCGGHPMVGKDDSDAAQQEVAAGFGEGALMGKRYADDDLGLELLVTKAGTGSLSVGDTPVPVKDPKRLPSSD
jgi:hypothetical protein